MRFTALEYAALLLVASPLMAAPTITAPAVTVGRNLQAWTAISLSQPLQEAVQFTLTSDDPSRLLLSNAPETAGAPSITLGIAAGRVKSPDFCLQGLADSGAATYTISAPGIDRATGTARLTRSAIAIVGPLKTPKFPTTPHGLASKLLVVSAAIDSAGKILEEQPLAGGLSIEVPISNSNPKAGVLGASKLVLTGGASTAETYFRPAAEGETTLAPVQPDGFSKPAERDSVVATIAKPGLAIAGDIFLGKDLQSAATVLLGEPAPAGGLGVVLTSSDPSKLLLSNREDQVGSGSITLIVSPGASNAIYYLQSLADSGEVTYTAEAPGFRSRTATIALAASGIIVSHQESGPPEEGNVLRKTGVHSWKEIYVSLSGAATHPITLVTWSAYIDRETGRAADFTVQPLRAGVKATVLLTSSDPTVGAVQSPLVIEPATNRAFGVFTPLKTGRTVISIDTPRGFATPKNATSVPAIVSD